MKNISNKTLSLVLATFFVCLALVVNEFSLASFLTARIGHVSYSNFLWGFRVLGILYLSLAAWLFWARQSIRPKSLIAIAALTLFLGAETLAYAFDVEVIVTLYYRNLLRLLRILCFTGFYAVYLHKGALSATAKKWMLGLVLFFLLDIATIYTDYEFIPDIRFNNLPVWANLIYVILYNLSILSCLVLFLYRSRWFTYAFGALFVVCSFTLMVYQEFGFFFNPAVARMAITETQGTDLGLYYKLVIGAGWKYLLLLLALVFGFAGLKNKLNIRLPKKAYLVPLLTAVGCLIFSISLNFHYTSFHPVYKVPLVFSSLLKPEPNLERQDPYFTTQQEALAKHVVLLVDESTTGARFSLNGFPMQNTPYLESIQDQIFNFGVASSGFTRTYLSHLFLQSGVRVPQVKENNFPTQSLPTIFQYAQQAGYKTIFIDGPYNGNEIIQQKDLDLFIDQYISILKKYPDTEGHLKDRLVMQEIEQALAKHPTEKLFVYAKKVGMHYPFVSRYPKDNTYFKPVLEDLDLFKSSILNLEKVINSHNNAVRWSTDDFFKEFLNHVRNNQNSQDTLVVYTSDHGHAIEGCFTAYCMELATQSSVPLIIFPLNIEPGLHQRLTQAQQLNYDRLSHFEIFPSLLWLFGYEKKQINQHYGPTVLDPIIEPRYQIQSHTNRAGLGFEERSRGKYSIRLYQLPDLVQFYQTETSLLNPKK